MKIWFTLFVSLGMILLFGGCETTTASKDSKTDPDAVTLVRGMTEDEVRKVMGEPLTIRETEMPEGILQIWVYEQTSVFSSQVAADTREIPYVNPITGEAGTEIESVMKLKTDSSTLTTDLFLMHGRLIGWKQSTSKDTRYEG